MARGLIAAALAAAVLAGAATGSHGRSLRPFAGTGSWVSIYDTAALSHPERVVARLQANGIHTLFLETSNDRQSTGVRRPVAVARLLDTAHAAHIAVVGWYLPSFSSPRADVRKALQGARFTSPSGVGFSAFALDIESTKIRSLRVRSTRAVAVARAVRQGLPHRMALGAITIDPVGARYWNGYPFARLARYVDVFLPMEYFTARASGARAVARYSRANVAAVRLLTGDARFPVHPIGGAADKASAPELRAFLRASRGTLGVSLWEYGLTSPRQLAQLGASR
ncbi:MAG TPA: hypothetical protein VI408_08690 [Gaiellaceae bacterium]